MLPRIFLAIAVLAIVGCATESSYDSGGNDSGLSSMMNDLGDIDYGAIAEATAEASNEVLARQEREQNAQLAQQRRNQELLAAQKLRNQELLDANLRAKEHKAQAARDARERTRLAQVERNRQIAAAAERARVASNTTTRPSLSNTPPPKMVRTPKSEWGPIYTLHFNSGKDWDYDQETGEQAFGGFMIKVKAKRAQMGNSDPSRRAVAYFRNISGEKMCISSTVSTKPPTRTNEMTTVRAGQTRYNTDNYFDKSAPVVYVMVQTKVCD